MSSHLDTVPTTITDHQHTVPRVAPSTPAPESQPLPYHRLMRSSPRSARWWRPIGVLAVTLGMLVALSIPLLILAVIAEEGLLGAGWIPTEELTDPSNPMDLLFGLGLIAIMLPAALLGMRWGGGAAGILHSVASRVRWRLMLSAGAIVLPVFAAVIVASFLLAPPADFAWPDASLRTLAVYAIIILLAPLQCAAEEYIFRGLPMQVLGAWLRSPVWGILIPVPIFMLGHGYDWAGQIDIAVFAICMGLLVWKSGGLELAIVVHTANNLILFLLAPFSQTSMEQGAVDPRTLLLSLPLTIGITAVLWVWVSRRHQVGLREPVRSTAEMIR